MTRSTLPLAAIFALSVVACSRTASEEKDYTEEAEQLCEASCERIVPCSEEPDATHDVVTWDDCLATCLATNCHDQSTHIISEDSECGALKREWKECANEHWECFDYGVTVGEECMEFSIEWHDIGCCDPWKPDD